MDFLSFSLCWVCVCAQISNALAALVAPPTLATTTTNSGTNSDKRWTIDSGMELRTRVRDWVLGFLLCIVRFRAGWPYWGRIAWFYFG